MKNVDKNALHWFPMRVTYGRELMVHQFLDKQGIENFLPVRKQMVLDGNTLTKNDIPYISNLIFIHDTMNNILKLKHGTKEGDILRFMTYRPTDTQENREIITVPERQMNSFILVCQSKSEDYEFLTTSELQGKTQASVKIISGPFKGVEGVIKRVHNIKHVVVEIPLIGGVCINFVPKMNLELAKD